MCNRSSGEKDVYVCSGLYGEGCEEPSFYKRGKKEKLITQNRTWRTTSTKADCSERQHCICVWTCFISHSDSSGISEPAYVKVLE